MVEEHHYIDQKADENLPDILAPVQKQLIKVDSYYVP